MLKQANIIDDGQALENAMVTVAAAMADASRVKILCALMDGRAWTATELSVVAEVSSSTTSAHLARLVSGNLLTCLSQGRHRYYRLSGREVAELLEKVMGISWQSASSAKITTPSSLRLARTCYDHLAGEVAVSIYDAMLAQGWLTIDGSALTAKGLQQFAQLGITLNSHSRRKKCSACLDWSERRFHLGGEAGAAFFAHCERQRWITRVPGYREVSITLAGKRAINKLFGVTVSE
ncbi:helix-turn-helix transcriptional regulator [Klebsiella sp. BIGb0407]|uniref:ArsR/SmtB family transcription factor n=1 Tax=Klebsiella sp. BIGb0407 TaxID=2940603 RepID=UPI0021690172|nr:metalloregulator ArsR/SmtB family transcription factor [Klebsiella sp. BIGb0407]MCS3433808.1 DNA-binding transcriptional ArsR family regulator [Klebsiella sp. BIGb0407]